MKEISTAEYQLLCYLSGVGAAALAVCVFMGLAAIISKLFGRR